MEIFMILVFLLGYIFIATEHGVKINKSATALFICGILWLLCLLSAAQFVPTVQAEAFGRFLQENPDLLNESLYKQCLSFVVDVQILGYAGEAAETILFLMGAMTIVELIDTHDGFNFITQRITTKNKIKLLWIISILTFFMSALLDNMTTAIVMVMLLRKLVGNYKERWLFASVIIIAANSGGVWSPIGDVTTIMLWVKGTIKGLFLPSLVSCLIPTFLAARLLKGILRAPSKAKEHKDAIPVFSQKESLSILILGVLVLLMVPVLKSLCHFPPFLGIITGLGVMWIYTDILYKRKKNIAEVSKRKVSQIIRNIDMSTILFFLGILMAVSALSSVGILQKFSSFLDSSIHNVYVINLLIGGLSAIVDNVPLVASAIGMYSIPSAADLAAATDLTYMQAFLQDGTFWQFLAYCAGVGGSMLIIGSAAGVVVMGLEKISFGWYLKNISLMAFTGYIAGALVYIFI
ncbi:MAG: sodium:proton antiporter NhaD [Bacteroidales bacterium]